MSLQRQGERLGRAIPGALKADAARLDLIQGKLAARLPTVLDRESQSLASKGERLMGMGATLLASYEAPLQLIASRMHDLSPLAVMGRGYSISKTPEGRVVTSVGQLAVADAIDIHMSDGVAHCQVQEVEANPDREPLDGQ